MNILHLSAVKNWGGGENHIENLYLELNQVSGIRNIIFCVRNGHFHQRLREKGIAHIAAPMAYKLDPRFFRKLNAVCQKKSIDIVHIHDSTALAQAVIASHFKKLPPFIFSKKTSFPIQGRKQTLYKYNHQNIKKILCVSEFSKNISAPMIRDPEKLCVIYHGTCFENKSKATPFLLREKLSIPAGNFIIGNIANHIWPKDLETFIRVAHELVNIKKMKNFHFVQIGNFSGETKNLTLLIEKYKLQQNFSFLGFLPDASNFIPQFDLSVITSKSEGIPQVIYESFYHKVPVVSTNVGGIPEIIEHNKNGLLAERSDYKNISKHILTLSTDKNLQKEFVKVSREKLNNFTTKLMAEKTLNEYKKVLSKSDVLKNEPKWIIKSE